MKDTVAATGGNSIPVEIGPTSPRRHITGVAALNIPDPRHEGGDWHNHATWFATEPERLDERDFTDEETYGVLLDELGRSGVRDARAGLRALGHPAGESESPIWTAAYDRAVVETAWAQLRTDKLCGEVPDLKPVDSLELTRWLCCTLHWARLTWWAWKLRWALRGDERRKWDTWRREWRPWA